MGATRRAVVIGSRSPDLERPGVGLVLAAEHDEARVADLVLLGLENSLAFDLWPVSERVLATSVSWLI